MLKFTTLALATVIGATTLIPSMASAIDNGPCDHCTMDPIVVTGGDDPDKEKSQTATKQIKASQPVKVIVKTGR